MRKNRRDKRAYAAKTEVLRKIAQEKEPQKLLASNEMITNVVNKDFVGLLKMKLLSNGLLNVSLGKRDMRIPIFNRNAAQSPLLRLPAEIRNKIFRMVVGEQHIHISVFELPQKPAKEGNLPPVTIKEVDQFTDYLCDLRYRGYEMSCAPWRNNTYPLDWRAHYTNQPVTHNQKTKYLCKMIPDKRIVWGSGNHMTNLTRVCRQIYDEVGLLTYSTNEFSFCSPWALESWLCSRLVAQRQAIKVLWVDSEWAHYGYAPQILKDLCPTGATLKISRLAWSVVSKAYWEANADRNIADCPISDASADMNERMKFDRKWLGPARRSEHLKVEWVKE